MLGETLHWRGLRIIYVWLQTSALQSANSNIDKIRSLHLVSKKVSNPSALTAYQKIPEKQNLAIQGC